MSKLRQAKVSFESLIPINQDSFNLGVIYIISQKFLNKDSSFTFIWYPIVSFVFIFGHQGSNCFLRKFHFFVWRGKENCENEFTIGNWHDEFWRYHFWNGCFFYWKHWQDHMPTVWTLPERKKISRRAYQRCSSKNKILFLYQVPGWLFCFLFTVFCLLFIVIALFKKFWCLA